MKEDYNTILLEEIRDQNKALLEGQKDQATRADIQRLEQRLDVLEGDVKTIKAAVKDTTCDLKAHTANGRIHFISQDAFGQRAAA